MNAPRVLLADPHVPARTGVRLALEEKGFATCGEESEARGAIAAALARRPDLALVTTELSGDALRAVREISAQLPACRVVVLSPNPNEEELLASVLAGAAGYLGKEIEPSRLPVVLRAVLEGEAALPRGLSLRLLDELRGRGRRAALVARHVREPLTPREWQMLELLGAGLRTSEIALRTAISQVTVRRHVSSLVAKLGLRSRSALIDLLRSGG